MNDLVHDVETIYGICYLLTASGNPFLNINDVNCSFTCITHISENISRLIVKECEI